MAQITQVQLKTIEQDHIAWIDGAGGARASFVAMDLSGLIFDNHYFRGADFTGANLNGCVFTSNGYGSQTSFRSILYYQDGVETVLHRTTFTNASFVGAVIDRNVSYGESISFRYAKFTNCNFTNCTIIEGTSYVDKMFTNVAFDGCNFNSAKFTNVKLEYTYLGCNWSNVTFYNCNLRYAGFVTTATYGGIATTKYEDALKYNNTNNVNLTYITVMTNSKFEYCDLGLTEFKVVDLNSSVFTNCIFHISGYTNAGRFFASSLNNVNLSGANLDYYDFTGCSMICVNLTGSILTNNDSIYNPNFKGLNLTGSSTHGTQFSGNSKILGVPGGGKFYLP